MKKIIKFYYSAFQKGKNSNTIIIRNENLTFDTSNFTMNLFPYHPEIIKKTNNVYQIKKYSTVLSFTLLKKNSRNIDENQINYKSFHDDAWQQRKSFGLRFNDLAKIIEVEPFGGKSISIERPKKKMYLTDNKGQSVRLKLQAFQNAEQSQSWMVQTEIKILDYMIIHHLLKESLFDLSGMRFTFEMKNREQILKIIKFQNMEHEINTLTDDDLGKII